MTIKTNLAFLGLLAFVTGCYTHVSMTKVTRENPNPEGLRVHLPSAFVVGRMTTNSGAGAFLTDDILDFPSLARKLSDTNCPLSSIVAKEFPVRLRGDLENYTAALENTRVQTDVANGLDLALAKSSLFSKEAFKNVKLSKATETERAKANPTGGNFTLLNHLLLHDAFPEQFQAGPGPLTFADFPSFSVKLAEHTDPVVAALWNTLPSPLQDDTKKYAADLANGSKLQPLVAQYFNALVHGPPLPTDSFPKDAQLSPETKALLTGTLSGPSASVRLNWSILVEADRLSASRVDAKTLKSPSFRIVYSVEMLPDPDRQYAISSYTLMGKQKIAVKRSIEMYLKQVDLTQDSTAVAQALLGAVSQTAQSSGQSTGASSTSGKTSSKKTTTTKTTDTTGADASQDNAAGGQPGGQDNGNGGGGAKKGGKSTTTTEVTSVEDQVSSQPPIKVIYRIVETSASGASSSKLPLAFLRSEFCQPIGGRTKTGRDQWALRNHPGPARPEGAGGTAEPEHGSATPARTSCRSIQLSRHK